MPPGHDSSLLSVLTTAYGSAPLARIAVEAALADAGLADLPSSPHELASFVDTHLRAITEADLGGVIADALRAELLARQPITQLRLRKATSIMLVVVDDAEQAVTIDWTELAHRVLRVRQPIPACERMRIMRPRVVVVGPTVAGRDVEQLRDTAREIGCEVVELRPFVGRDALRDAVCRAVDRASSRRSDRTAT
jgi:hypothetical protein